ncbi:MAG: DUF1800 domain-containing protein [Pseudomonadota bacterium]
MRSETLSAIRFGYGRSPMNSAATTTAGLLDAAKASSNLSPRLHSKTRRDQIAVHRAARDKGQEAQQEARRTLRRVLADDVRAYLSFAVSDPGFGARLVSFWADHFTVAANGPLLGTLVPDFVETAIRPNIAGPFPDLLRAAIKHPAMLIYLNQVQSVGPNSRIGKRRERGLNENLAREILELHTLGVDAGYKQTDVQAFAELLTGLSADKGGFIFRQGISEPGPHLVLGKRYGQSETSLSDIDGALTDIALHPDTATHLARKLVLHFIGREDDALIARMADAYLAAKGDLPTLYAVMLDHDHAWTPHLQKAKLPFDFIVSALRAAGATAQDVAETSRGDLRTGVIGAMQMMGQPIFRPPGPDGWDENPDAWITPPGLAARIRWATEFAERIEATHDPRDFLQMALADVASPILEFAVGGSESGVEGIALTLVSPEFNRR